MLKSRVYARFYIFKRVNNHERAMGIDGLGQLNRADLQRIMAQRNSGARVQTSQQNINMTRNGSIFNMPRPDQTPGTVNSQRTQHFSNVSNNNKSVENKGQTEQNISVAEGKAAAASAESSAMDAKSGTATTEANTKQINSLASDTKKLSKTTKNEEKDMQKTLKNKQREVEKNNKEIQKMAENIEAESTSMDAIMSEMETLTAEQEAKKYSAYSLDISGEGSSSDEISQQLASLGSQMNSKGANITKYTGKINKLQTKNNKTIKTMNRVSKNYQKTVINTQAKIEANQTTTDKVMNVANKVGEISQYTSLTGQGVQLIGKGMRVLGQALMGTGYGALVGQALITASVPVESTGKTVETVGNYGSTAASITKSACSAANGDIAGAFTNAASAIMTGTAAAQGTKEMMSGFESIKDQATQAMQQGVAKGAANAEVKSMTEGMTKKEIKAEFGMSKGQMKDIAYNNSLQSVQETTAGMDYKQIGNAVKNNTTQGQSIMNSAQNSASSGITTSQTNIANAKAAVADQGKKAVKQAGKQAAKIEVANSAQGLGSGVAMDPTKAAKKAKDGQIMAYAQKAASSLQMAGSMIAQFQQSQALYEPSGYAYQDWDRLNRIHSNRKIMGRYAA